MVHKKIVNDGDYLHWDMQFEGYQRNLIYTFYNPYGDLFLHKDKRANASYDYEEGKLSLSIKRVTAEDLETIQRDWKLQMEVTMKIMLC
ncbi:UNVERIFIED_CONTAM: hypothetical protein RMT77_014020 [Armadillidium vulgare]